VVFGVWSSLVRRCCCAARVSKPNPEAWGVLGGCNPPPVEGNKDVNCDDADMLVW